MALLSVRTAQCVGALTMQLSRKDESVRKTISSPHWTARQSHHLKRPRYRALVSESRHFAVDVQVEVGDLAARCETHLTTGLSS